MPRFPVYPTYEHTGTPQFASKYFFVFSFVGFNQARGVFFSVEVTSISLEHWPLPPEPFFFNLCLFDMQRKEKLSENFSVEINGEILIKVPHVRCVIFLDT